MTIICVAFPTYKVIKDYQHRKRVERYEIVCTELTESTTFLAEDQHKVTIEEFMNSQSRLGQLRKEANELSKYISEEEDHMIQNRARAKALKK